LDRRHHSGLLIWVIWELVRLWRGRQAGSTWRQRLVADRYRLSAAAALMGIANAVLYGWHDTWPYTKILGDGARQLAGVETSTDPTQWALFGALVVGVVVGIAVTLALMHTIGRAPEAIDCQGDICNR